MAATVINVGSTTRATAQVAEVNGNTTDGNTFVNDGRTDLWYRNAGSTQRTFNVVSTKTIGSETLAVADLAVTVLASSDWVPLGYFDPDIYGTLVTISGVSHSDVRFKAWKHG